MTNETDALLQPDAVAAAQAGATRLIEALRRVILGKEQTIEDLMYANWLKEVFMDSDTKVALISGAPSDIPEDWFCPDCGVREKIDFIPFDPEKVQA